MKKFIKDLIKTFIIEFIVVLVITVILGTGGYFYYTNQQKTTGPNSPIVNQGDDSQTTTGDDSPAIKQGDNNKSTINYGGDTYNVEGDLIINKAPNNSIQTNPSNDSTIFNNLRHISVFNVFGEPLKNVLIKLKLSDKDYLLFLDDLDEKPQNVGVCTSDYKNCSFADQFEPTKEKLLSIKYILETGGGETILNRVTGVVETQCE